MPPTFRVSPRAERRVRRLGITTIQVLSAIATATAHDQDVRGSHRFEAEIDGVALRVVLAPTDNLLIDTIEEL